MESIIGNHLVPWILGLVAVLLVVDLVLRVLGRFPKWEPKSSPPISGRVANLENTQKQIRKELDDRGEQIEDLGKKMDQRFEQAASLSQASRQKIYESIRDLEKTTSSQSKGQELHGQQLARLDGKIDKILERLSK